MLNWQRLIGIEASGCIRNIILYCHLITTFAASELFGWFIVTRSCGEAVSISDFFFLAGWLAGSGKMLVIVSNCRSRPAWVNISVIMLSFEVLQKIVNDVSMAKTKRRNFDEKMGI